MIMKRILSLALAIVMVLSLIPVIHAADGTELTGLTVPGLSVFYGETWSVYNGALDVGYSAEGVVEWYASGRQIDAVTRETELTSRDEQFGAELTFVNTLGVPATLRFEYVFNHSVGATENLNDYAEVWNLTDMYGKDAGKVELELTDSDPYTITIVSQLGGRGFNPATLTITNISLSTGADVTATFEPAENGSYSVDGEKITVSTPKTAASGAEYTVSATAAEGYRFFGWYDGSNYVSYQADAVITVNQDCSIAPVFIKDDIAVFGVGEVRFQSLSEADTYAKNGAVKTIVLMNDGILTGEHTISAGNTLLIPYDHANTVHIEATPTAIKSDNLWINVDWSKPTAYRTLTMTDGAKLTIQGALNVGGRHHAGPWQTAGSPSGDVGMIQMAEGSNITVADGGTLYCWGYIYGDGTVTAKNGATVHENIQFTDFRGGNATAGIAMSFLVFPMSQYYVQNIEVATTFEYGSIENVWGSIFLGSNNQVYGTSVQFIGYDPNTAMFVPGTAGTVTKTFIAKDDRLQMDVDGDGSINPMTLDMEAITAVMQAPLNTKTFVLPITNNMTININSGTTTLNQSLALLPGVRVSIDNGAVLHVNSGEPYMVDGEPVLYKGGHNLIVYDREQWFEGWVEVHDENGEVTGIELIDTYYVYSGKRLQPVAFSVTGSYTRKEADLVDAVLDINGTLTTDGFIYNTCSIVPNEDSELGYDFTGSTPIISSGKTGKVVMNNGAGMDMMTMQASQVGSDPYFVNLFMISARLENKDGTYLETIGAEPGAVFDYCTWCDAWYSEAEREEHNHDIAEVSWIVDGNEFTQEFIRGQIPVYNGRFSLEKEGYEFIGWKINDGSTIYKPEELPPVEGDEAYTACFQKKAPAGMLGDLDGDKDVDATDLTLLACHVAGIAELTDATALKNADVDGNKQIDANDLTIHACYVAGIIDNWN